MWGSGLKFTIDKTNSIKSGDRASVGDPLGGTCHIGLSRRINHIPSKCSDYFIDTSIEMVYNITIMLERNE